jgi:hypothetical protein
MRFSILLLTIGCTRAPVRCVASAPSTVELRDGQGALVMAAKREPSGALALCDDKGMRTGELRWEGKALRFYDRASLARLTLTPDGVADYEGMGPTAERLRIHRDVKETYVLEPNGVRFGFFVPAPPNVNIYDKQSVPIGTVEPSGANQTVKTIDGDLRFTVQPANSSVAAGVFALNALQREEQMALFLLLSR